MKCNLCGSEKSEIIAGYTRFEKNNVYRCLSCGLVFLEVKSDRIVLEDFYSSEYRKISTLPVMSPEEHFNYNVTLQDTAQRLEFISANVNIKGKKILEIGSASGSLMTGLKRAGCGEVCGVELGEEYAAYSRDIGFTVYSDSLEQLRLDDTFDAVVSFHTIEHVFDPSSVISAVYSVLKPGGYFLGEVPNQDDWRISIFDDETAKRFHYDPVHYYYFSPDTFGKYLKKSGFSDNRFETVERYNSLMQLKNILCSGEADIEETLKKHIFPETSEDETRIQDIDDNVTVRFNELFAIGVNAGLRGNCLRWIAKKDE